MIQKEFFEENLPWSICVQYANRPFFWWDFWSICVLYANNCPQIVVASFLNKVNTSEILFYFFKFHFLYFDMKKKRMKQKEFQKKVKISYLFTIILIVLNRFI